MPTQIQKWIKLRNTFSQSSLKLTPPQNKKIIFHAASGEIEYVKSIIREFKQLHSEIEIIVTYSSPSAEKLFANIRTEVTQFIPLPWDTPFQIENLLNTLQPEMIVFSRTDFWPEFIHQACIRNIPLVGVSLYPRFGFFQNIWLKFILSKFSLLTAVTEKICSELGLILKNKKIIYLPDTRFDQVVYRLNSDSKVDLISNKNICVFGSTWPEDEQILFKCIDQILKYNFKIIWCPHDISKSRIDTLSEQLKKYSVSYFSDYTNPLKLETDILILDRIGYLADIYRFSQISFVGGSFKSKVHSVMEPLCAGNTVIVGPYYKNNPEAVQFLEKKFVHSISNAAQFKNVFKDIIQNFQKSKIQNEMLHMMGSSKKTAVLISGLFIQSV